MPPPPASFRIEEADHFAFWQMVFRRTALRCCVWGLAAIAVVCVVPLLVGADLFDASAGVIAGCIVIVALLGLQWLTLRRRAAKVYRESAFFEEDIIVRVDEHEFVYEQKTSNVRLSWDRVAKWDEDASNFTIHPNRLMAYLLPKRAVPPELVNYCRERLRASGMAKAGKLRK